MSAALVAIWPVWPESVSGRPGVGLGLGGLDGEAPAPVVDGREESQVEVMRRDWGGEPAREAVAMTLELMRGIRREGWGAPRTRRHLASWAWGLKCRGLLSAASEALRLQVGQREVAWLWMLPRCAGDPAGQIVLRLQDPGWQQREWVVTPQVWAARTDVPTADWSAGVPPVCGQDGRAPPPAAPAPRPRAVMPPPPPPEAYAADLFAWGGL